MKNMRHFLAGLVGAALLFGPVSAAFAYGHSIVGMPDCGGGGCAYAPYPMAGKRLELSEEKRAALNTLMEECRAAMEPLREQLEAKRLELNALSGNPNARPDDISRLAKETAALHTKIRSVGRNFRDKAQKELGVPAGAGTGMKGGHGMRGYHHMRGCNW